MTNPTKPVFRREDRNKKVRLKGKWRKPKGIHSKMRHAFRGRAPVVGPGYRIPVGERGKDVAGKLIVLVHNSHDLQALSSDSAIIIAASVGARLRLSIMDAAEKSGISITNIRKPGDYRQGVQLRLQQNKERRTKAVKERESKSKKKEQKKEAPQEKSEEQKKEEQRAEQEKVLTQRQT